MVGNQAAANAATAAQQQQQVKKSCEVLRRNLEKQKQAAEKGKLPDVTALLNKLEKGTKELALQGDREKAMVTINDLARQIANSGRNSPGRRRSSRIFTS